MPMIIIVYCNELLNFEMEVKNISMTKCYDISDSVRVLVIGYWLGYDGLQFAQTLNDEEHI